MNCELLAHSITKVVKLIGSGEPWCPSPGHAPPPNYCTCSCTCSQCLFPAELANTVQISGSSNPLAAGRRHSLTCHVTSDITPTVKWVGLDGTELETGEGMIVSEPVRYGLNTTMVLTFDTLKTSHGGDYSCVSSTNYPTTEVTATRELIVQSKSQLTSPPPPHACTHAHTHAHTHMHTHMHTLDLYLSVDVMTSAVCSLPPRSPKLHRYRGESRTLTKGRGGGGSFHLKHSQTTPPLVNSFAPKEPPGFTPEEYTIKSDITYF